MSGNPLVDINTEQFSPLCNLKSIDFNETHIPACQCQTLNRYLLIRLVMIENLNCDLNARGKCPRRSQSFFLIGCFFLVLSNCPRYEDMANETIEYYKCQDITAARAADQMAKSSWLVIAASLIGFLIVFTGKF